jgi:hypothetical protein
MVRMEDKCLESTFGNGCYMVHSTYLCGTFAQSDDQLSMLITEMFV